jgi:hypothetical protein
VPSIDLGHDAVAIVVLVGTTKRSQPLVVSIARPTHEAAAPQRPHARLPSPRSLCCAPERLVPLANSSVPPLDTTIVIVVVACVCLPSQREDFPYSLADQWSPGMEQAIPLHLPFDLEVLRTHCKFFSHVFASLQLQPTTTRSAGPCVRISTLDFFFLRLLNTLCWPYPNKPTPMLSRHTHVSFGFLGVVSDVSHHLSCHSNVDTARHTLQ